jgi:hypothetical protein
VRPSQTTSGRIEPQESLVLTLALDPMEAQRLDLARKEADGEISVIVRAPNDTTIQNIPGVGPESLLDHPTTPPSGAIPVKGKKR